MKDLFVPHLQTIISMLFVFFLRDRHNAMVLKTITSLAQFYGRDHTSLFYTIIRQIASIACKQHTYNNEEYVRELIKVLGVLSSICYTLLNEDKECIQQVIEIAYHYILTASPQPRGACLMMFNKMLQMEIVNENINAVFTQMAPQMLDVGISLFLNIS